MWLARRPFGRHAGYFLAIAIAGAWLWLNRYEYRACDDGCLVINRWTGRVSYQYNKLYAFKRDGLYWSDIRQSIASFAHSGRTFHHTLPSKDKTVLAVDPRQTIVMRHHTVFHRDSATLSRPSSTRFTCYTYPEALQT